MPIKTIPVCPFCGKDMTKREDVLLPKGLVIIPLPKRDPNEATSSDGLRIPQGITDSIYLHIWECEGCGFVALWKGNPR